MKKVLVIIVFLLSCSKVVVRNEKISRQIASSCSAKDFYNNQFLNVEDTGNTLKLSDGSKQITCSFNDLCQIKNAPPPHLESLSNTLKHKSKECTVYWSVYARDHRKRDYKDKTDDNLSLILDYTSTSNSEFQLIYNKRPKFELNPLPEGFGKSN